MIPSLPASAPTTALSTSPLPLPRRHLGFEPWPHWPLRGIVLGLSIACCFSCCPRDEFGSLLGVRQAVCPAPLRKVNRGISLTHLKEAMVGTGSS